MVQIRWESYGGDITPLRAQLERLLVTAGGRAALIMDSAGRLLTAVGEYPDDPTGFVALLAADFCATRELAAALGQDGFHSVFHEGRYRSLVMSEIVEGVILAVVHDRATTLGLVRYAIRRAQPVLAELLIAGQAEPVPREEGLNREQRQEALEALDRFFDFKT